MVIAQEAAANLQGLALQPFGIAIAILQVERHAFLMVFKDTCELGLSFAVQAGNTCTGLLLALNPHRLPVVVALQAAADTPNPGVPA